VIEQQVAKTIMETLNDQRKEEKKLKNVNHSKNVTVAA
jgi:hypothetical protein